MGVSRGQSRINQVIRDSHHLKQRPGTKISAQNKAAFARKLRTFVSGCRDEDDEADEDKNIRLMVILTTKALDHSLRFADLSLHEYTITTGIRPLRATEERYFVDKEDLDEELLHGDLSRRAAVFDRKTKTTMLEFIRPKDGRRRRLHTRSDRGTIGWQV